MGGAPVIHRGPMRIGPHGLCGELSVPPDAYGLMLLTYDSASHHARPRDR